MRRSTCKGCGKPIIWVPTPGGKAMPCDPEPLTYWERPKAPGKIVTPNGETLSCIFEGDLQNATGIGYRPHWASCPKYKDFKKGARP